MQRRFWNKTGQVGDRTEKRDVDWSVIGERWPVSMVPIERSRIK